MKGLAILAAVLVATVGTTRAAADRAMDLTRRESRWVVVQVSTTRPDDRGSRLSEPALGWYKAGPGRTRRTVTVPGAAVERVFFADHDPVERSFSDFEWVFDAATGHVVSASVSGRVDEPVRIGLLRTSARVSIGVRLSTHLAGGYRTPRRLAGRTVVGYCPDPVERGCTAVAASAYDPVSGRVRANGTVCAVWRSFRTLAYTWLGHARFRELDASGRPGDAPGPLTLLERPASAGARPC